MRERSRRASQERAVRRGELSGSGPVRTEGPVAAFPGARSWFALLGEVFLVGVVVVVLGAAVVTLPAALVVGSRHLGRHVRAEDTSLWLAWRDLRASFPGGLGVGAGVLFLVVVCLFDLGLAASDDTAVGTVMLVVGVAGLAVLGTGLVVCASLWTPERGWSGAVAGVRPRVEEDLGGAGLLGLVVGFVALVTWQFTPLLVPALGCAAFAMVAVPLRRHDLGQPASMDYGVHRATWEERG